MRASRDTLSLRPGGGLGCPFLRSRQRPSFLPRQVHPAAGSSAQGPGCWVGKACPDMPLCPPGKIDMFKSKWGLALAAVVTVLSSLLMSVGLCTLFGLTPTLNGG